MELLNDLPSISDTVIQNFKLDIDGDHGKYHWNRVYLNALMLSKHYSLDNDHFFALFALFHDSCRDNEFWDEKHGKHGGDYAKTFHNRGVFLTNNELDKLYFACANHTVSDLSHPFSKDIMVQICWDSDRLDLGRIGIQPDAKYLFTDYAKKLAIEPLLY